MLEKTTAITVFYTKGDNDYIKITRQHIFLFVKENIKRRDVDTANLANRLNMHGQCHARGIRKQGAQVSLHPSRP